VFLAYWGLVQHGIPVVAVFLVCGVGVMLLSALEERVAFRPVRHLEGHLVTAVGAATLLTGGAQLIWGTQALQVPFFTGNNTPFTLLGGRLQPDELWLIAIAVVSGVVIYTILRRTMLGLACLAASENREAATLRGVNARLLSLGAFAVAGAFAGVVAPFVAPKTFATITLGEALALKGFVPMALGGFGSIPGCMIGGFAVGMAEALTARYIGAVYENLIIFGLLLLVLMVRPTGLLGERAERLV
jgi:branched-chain amino acid transport system permease protein